MYVAPCCCLSLLLLFLVHSESIQNQSVCGRPGKPLDGRFLPANDVYYAFDMVNYQCPGRILIGNRRRRCEEKGRWSGSVPICLKIILDIKADAKDYHVKHDLLKETSQLWTDSSNTGCTKSYPSDGLRISLEFKNGPFSLDGFDLTFSTSSYPKFRAFSLHHGNNNHETLCNMSDITQSLDVSLTTVRLDCFSVKQSTGILLEFVTKEVTVSLCQLTPRIKHPSSVGCETPDTPINGKIQGKIGSTTKGYDFSCNPGYEIKGVKSTLCNSNGTWSKPSPTCVKSHPNNFSGPEGNNTSFPRRGKGFLYSTFAFGVVSGALAILIVVGVVAVILFCKRKSNVTGRNRLNHSSQRSNSFDISYHRRNRSCDGNSSNRQSTGTVSHSNSHFDDGVEGGERPRSDVPDILENKIFNKFNEENKRVVSASAHIYADPLYSEMDDGQPSVMQDNVLYNYRSKDN